MNMLDKAMQEHCSLLREIAEKDAQIAILRDDARLTREAIARYCHPELRDSAENWLASKGI